MVPELDIADIKLANVNIIIPYVIIRFLPYISAIFPKGIKKIAEKSKYEVGIQLKNIALSEKVWAISGKAILIAELT